MANSFEIFVKGDFKQVTKGFLDVSKKLDEISRKKLSFKLDADSKKFFESGGDTILKKLKNNLKEAQLGMQDMAKTAGRSKFDFKNFQEATNRVSDLHEQIQRVENTMNRAQSGPMRRFFMNTTTGVLRKFGLGSGATSAVEGGIGKLGGAGGTIASMLAAGAAMFTMGAYSNAKAGYGIFNASNAEKLKLYGYGAKKEDINKAVNEGEKNFYSSGETINQGAALTALTGSMKNLGEYQTMSRAYGLGMGDLIGTAGNLRQQGLSQNASMKTMMTMIGDSMGSGLERSRIGEYLQLIAGYTSQMAQQKFGGINVSDVSETVSEIMRRSNGYLGQPGGAMAAFGAMDKSISTAAKGGFNLGAVQHAINTLYPEATTEQKLMFMRRGLSQTGNERTRRENVASGLLTEDEAKAFSGVGGFRMAQTLARQALQEAEKANLTPASAGRLVSLRAFGGQVGEEEALTLARGLVSNMPSVASSSYEKLQENMMSDTEAIRHSTEGIHENTKAMLDIMRYSIGGSVSGTVDWVKGKWQGFQKLLYGNDEDMPAGPHNGFWSKALSLAGPLGMLGGNAMDYFGNSKGPTAPKANGNLFDLNYKTESIKKNAQKLQPTMSNFIIDLNNKMQEEYGVSPLITDTFSLSNVHAKRSKHKTGKAVDISMRGWNDDMYQYAKQIGKQHGVDFQFHNKGTAPHYHAEMMKDVVNAVNHLHDTVKTQREPEHRHKTNVIQNARTVPRYNNVIEY